MSERRTIGALIAAVAYVLGLATARPLERVPALPPHEGLDGLRDCLVAVEVLEQDNERLQSRSLSADEIAANRAQVNDAIIAASAARSVLDYALADARPCAEQSIPGCLLYTPALLAERRAAVAKTAARLREKVTNASLSTR